MKQKGFSLVEILVAIGVLSVGALSVLQLSKETGKVEKTSKIKNQINILTQEISREVSNIKSCSDTFAGKRFGQNINGALEGIKRAGNGIYLTGQSYNGVTIKSMSISSNTDSLSDGKTTKMFLELDFEINNNQKTIGGKNFKRKIEFYAKKCSSSIVTLTSNISSADLKSQCESSYSGYLYTGIEFNSTTGEYSASCQTECTTAYDHPIVNCVDKDGESDFLRDKCSSLGGSYNSADETCQRNSIRESELRLIKEEVCNSMGKVYNEVTNNCVYKSCFIHEVSSTHSTALVGIACPGANQVAINGGGICGATATRVLNSYPGNLVNSAESNKWYVQCNSAGLITPGKFFVTCCEE
ncbi:MAG: prepilin-type N-terminal cleavage/methylation domain-containing protein [Bacteriovoracaceae bacterium]|jgi:prepilin-type N-terminal cleavage/methylation domain-containing protein|nr:prepilin-type N-terminal cleavage/methylation domain-containing protein [Bacteriovoracaceae bacterium]